MLWKADNQTVMTKGKLFELLKDVPDHVVINVLNDEGEATANMDIWFENLDTRKFLEITGKTPFRQLRQEKRELERAGKPEEGKRKVGPGA